MHDTFLLNKISKSLNVICQQSKIKNINRLTVVVSNFSHVNEENLLDYLQQNNAELLDNDFRVKIKRDDIEEQTAIIQNIQGETPDE